MIGDSSLTIELARLIVIHHDLVVVAGGEDLVRACSYFQAPDFTLEMRLDQAVLNGAIGGHDILELQN